MEPSLPSSFWDWGLGSRGLLSSLLVLVQLAVMLRLLPWRVEPVMAE